eukprot:GHVS01018788.1.p2 GENE.GHVS01018788.1~~GHVS01018788.1.p2  ORF type:complete len:115 (-),score=15.09 GHVS01018788.1:282-626(-)
MRGMEEDPKRWDEFLVSGFGDVAAVMEQFVNSFPEHHHMSYEISMTRPLVIIMEIVLKSDEGKQLNYNGRMVLLRDSTGKFGYKLRYASWMMLRRRAAFPSVEDIDEMPRLGEL